MENSQDAAIGAPCADTATLEARIARLEAIIEAEFGKRPVGPTLITIIEATARASGFSYDDLIGRARVGQPTLTKWRTVAMFLCRQKTDATYAAIGRKFGDRDPSTISDLVGNSDKYPDLRAIALFIENEL